MTKVFTSRISGVPAVVLSAMVVAGCFIISIPTAVSADDEHKYLDMSIEELMNVPVTSVSKSAGTLSGSPTAIFVLGSDEIRRSGATSLPELLRLVPGMQVGQVNGNRWAVSARGFNNVFANKLLVLVDGRTIYSPAFSGVMWEEQDMVLDNIDRIEVIRGPGAALWGANAVNGVINVITKNAASTSGTSVSALAGNVERATVQANHSARLGEDTHFRISARGYDRGPMKLPTGGDANDENQGGSATIRIDKASPNGDSIMFKAAARHMEVEQDYIRGYPIPPFIRELKFSESGSTYYAMTRVQHRIDDLSSTEVLFYYDYTSREFVGLEAVMQTINLEGQYEHRLSDGLKFVYGGAYRGILDDFEASNVIPLGMRDPESFVQIASAFAHSEIGLIPDRLTLTLGTKVEVNPYTQLEWEPNARLNYVLRDDHTIWTAVSRAVRMPSRINNDLSLNPGVGSIDLESGLPLEIDLNGSHDFQSENMMAYEAGYRAILDPIVSVDVAGFYNQYSDLETIEPIGLPGISDSGTLVLPTAYDNMLDGRSWGIESALTVSLSDRFRVRASHTFIDISLKHEAGSQDIGTTVAQGNDPSHQVKLQMSADMPAEIEWDVLFYYVDSLPSQNVGAYTRFDSRLCRKLSRQVDLSLVLQNMFDSGHLEFGDLGGLNSQASEIPRVGYIRLDWSF